MEAAKRILVVEDDEDLREMLGEIVEDAGYVAIHAGGREEAFLALESERPDLVLLDIMLPDGDGMEICRMASDPESADRPATVFIISGRNSLEYKLKGFLSGARRFISKPFNVDELLDAVRDTLKPGKATQAVGS